jgi:hypothetical protein
MVARATETKAVERVPFAAPDLGVIIVAPARRERGDRARR